MRNSGPVSEEVVSCRRLTQAARNAIERDQWDRAESLLMRALASCPADTESRRLYADVLWRLGKRNEAAAQLDHVLAQLRDDPELIEQRARMSLELGQATRAYNETQTAMDLDPQRPEPWILRARVRQQNGDLRGALGDYQRALSLAPRNREVLAQISSIYQSLDQPQRALVNLQALIDTFPQGDEPAQLHEQLGEVWTALGRHGLAVDAYLVARERGGPTPEVCCRLAEAELRAGHGLKAKQAVQEALYLAPDDPNALALLSRITLAERQRQGLQR